MNEDEEGVEERVVGAADVDVEGVGVECIDLAEGVCKPSENMSMAGAADFGGCEGADAEGGALEGPCSSSDMFALPLLREGGTNEVDGSAAGTSAGPSNSASAKDPSALALANSTASSRDCVSRLVRNTSPGPPPPPSTRSSFFSITGTGCFGAGSILRSEDMPAPVLGATRGFLVGGPSSPSSSGGGREGRLMAIFLVRLSLCGAVLVVELELEGSGREREDEDDFGGGSASVDLDVGGGSFESSDVDVASVGVVGVFDVVVTLSSPLSPSLP